MLQTVTKVVDEIDLKIIEALREDGRTPNKTLAMQLGVSETTIASRIRGLRERKIMLVTLQPGAYTVVVSGNNSGTGVGLVEVYEVP